MSVKNICILFAAALAGLLLILTGCARKPLPEPPSLRSFTWRHRGSSTGEIYSYTAERMEGGSRILLSLYAGSRELELFTEADVLAQLEAVAAAHRLDRWDGFDKNGRGALDGTGFTLSMTTAEGAVLEARGSNAFPKGYAEAKVAIESIFEDYIDHDMLSDDMGK